jgi:hypothetical protein
MADPSNAHAATTELATPLPTPEVIQHVLLGGDLSKLTPPQRVAYYRAVCDSLGLNPLTRPFDYLRLSGKEVLYAKKDCAEQLRVKHKVSLGPPRAELLDGSLFTVSLSARMPDGREDSDMGAVDLTGLKGEARANAMMKCITKAKRRVTLSICGLGVLDETEIETIPNAQPLHFNPATGDIDAAAAVARPPSPAPKPSKRPASKAATPATPTPVNPHHRPDLEPLTDDQRKKLWAQAKDRGWTHDVLKTALQQAFGVESSRELRVGDFDQVLALIDRRPPPAMSDDEAPF